MLEALPYNQYVDFAPFINQTDAQWMQLHEEMCLSMSNCQVRYGTGGYQHQTDYETRGLTGGTYLKNLVHELPEHLRDKFNAMDILQKTMFATWYFGFNAMPLIYVRGTTQYEKKHLPEGSIENENTKHFGALYDWIDKSGLFETTGRITVFLSPQGYESRKHKDLPPGTPYRAIDEFVWINPRGIKKFYLENDSGEQSEIESRAAWFNTYQYHGARASQQQLYAIRIDGRYTHEAREFARAAINRHCHPCSSKVSPVL